MTYLIWYVQFLFILNLVAEKVLYNIYIVMLLKLNDGLPGIGPYVRLRACSFIEGSIPVGSEMCKYL